MFSFNKSKVDTNPEKIERLLTRNVEEIFIKENLRKQLLSGRRLKIKLGFDPTGSKIHIGRAIVLRKLREFQDLGHEIIFLVGDFTARIGDPSDKLEKRPMIDSKKIQENLKDYKRQVGKIIDLKKVRFVYNNDWLAELKFDEIVNLAESFTVSQMTSRRNFKDRLDKGEEVSLREFLYPLMQGYDSYELEADVELGGFDQLFNLKAGRIIQKHYGMREQDILTTVMLEGTDGRKMSTSWGNVINTIDEPNDMYGKVMSVRDDLIVKYMRACTDMTDAEIAQVEADLAKGSNPRDAKMRLGRELVTMYHSKEAADKAEQNFISTFQKKEGAPEDTKEVKVSVGAALVDVVIAEGVAPSKSEWRRLLDSGAVSNVETAEKITDPNYKVSAALVIKAGKKRFLKISIK